MSVNAFSGSGSPRLHDEPLGTARTSYGLFLVGFNDQMRDLVSSLVPAIDTFLFLSTAISPQDIDMVSDQLLKDLKSFYEKRKLAMKRIIVVGFEFSGFIVKRAMASIKRTPVYHEVAVMISDLIFISTPHRFYNGSGPTDKTSLIRRMIPPIEQAPEAWVKELATHLDSIARDFARVRPKYNITNIQSKAHVPIDQAVNPWIFNDGVEVEETLKCSLNSPDIFKSIDDLVCLHKCLNPSHLLSNDTIFNVRDYIDCLKRLSWSWDLTAEEVKPDDISSMDFELVKHFKSVLKPNEQEYGNYPSSVCLIGPPGSGKTSLLRTLHLVLQEQQDIITIIFTKKTFHTINPSVVDVLKSFLHQTLFNVPSVFSHITRYYAFLVQQEAWTEQLLWSFVANLLRYARKHRFVIIIDDPDHRLIPCVENLVTTLEKLRQSSKFGLQVVHTINSNSPALSLTPYKCIDMAGEEGYKQATLVLLQKAISRMQLDMKPSTIQSIFDTKRQSFSDNCLTTYLYFKQISRLSTITTPAILDMTLLALPQAREKIYLAAVEKISCYELSIAKWCWDSLSWILRAVHPLSFLELSVAVALLQMGPLISKDEIKRHMSVSMWNDLDRHLGLLVNTDNKPFVTMIHDSAEEFIDSYNKRGDNEYVLANHAKLTVLCLRYLNFVLPTWTESTTAKEQPEYGFVKYAIENWPRHYQLATREFGDSDQINDLDQHVLDFLSHDNGVTLWFQRYQKTTSRLVFEDSEQTHWFKLACGLGLTNIISRLLKENNQQIINDELLLEKSLDAAIKNGQSVIALDLIKIGAQSGLALSLAAERNMADVVDQLISNNTRTETPTEMEIAVEKAILAAATNGCLQSIYKLCDFFHNDAEKLLGIKFSALEAAVTGGHTSMVSFLLKPPVSCKIATSEIEHGSDTVAPIENSDSTSRTPDTITTKYSIALETAAESGDDKIVSLLFDAGAKATHRALECASKQRNINTIARLVERFEIQNTALKGCMALHFASERGYSEIVEELIKCGSEIDFMDKTRQTPLHKAAKRGHTQIIHLLIEKKADRNIRDDEGAMPCHLAAQGGHIETYKALQEDPQLRQDDLVVNYAATGGHLAMVKYLLPLKTAVVSTNAHILDSTVSEAASRGHLSIVRELGEAGWELSTRTGTPSPLHHAAAGGYFKIVAYLVDKGVEINNRDEAMRTPLHLAVAFPKIINLLLTIKDADLNAVDLNGRSPLHIAAASPKSKEISESVKSMLNRKPDVDIQDDENATPLHLAAMQADYDMLKSLLEAGADPNILNYLKESPLHCVVNLANEQERESVGACVKLLLDHGANGDTQDYRKQTPLHWAACYGHMDSIRALLEAGADTGIRGRYGRIALTEAIMEENLEAAELLLQKGSDINGGDTKFTPLYLRSGMDNLAILRFLLDRQADFRLLSTSGFSPLYRAAEYGQRENVHLLLERGADIHQTCKGIPVLHIAISKGHLEVVEVLLDHGAKTDAVNEQGETALHRAVGRKNLAIVNLLLKYGADIRLEDNRGNTALDKAEEIGQEDIINALENFSSNTSVS